MSAPDTNIERQTDRHWPSIIGICFALAVGVAIGLGIAYVTDVDGPQVSEIELQNGTAVMSDG
ncbi:hypothetical protein [Roseobacter sinensis]|uniref:Uncharacterized protein n=1 Tax=Roseobacter sinensis TaxID=2931391 RepID=A0ABT3BKP4_9RHOB|nr:hypothetical protein [Roseobacter sp. WL0113]MCV3273924.1 hypothetical protein [Roseobacter sp. WL0113]